MSGHAAGAVLDGQRLVAPPEGGGLLWVESPVVLWREVRSLSNVNFRN